jgi:DNA-directed RNA polymerase subunit M/transcription elongation factor TFIIS
MALPKINESPKYKVTIPSMKREVFYRPFYVKEQKILLMAMESQDQELILKAMVDTISSCLEEDINPNSLTTFDVEYIFTKIRSKSAGESANIILSCKECKADNEVSVNLEEIPAPEVHKIEDVVLNDKYTLKLRYPRYNHMLESLQKEEKVTATGLILDLAMASLDKLLTEDESITFDDETDEEKTQFIDNLNSDQFKKIMAFVEDLPKLSKDVEFKCEKCKHENNYTLQGIQDFF